MMRGSRLPLFYGWVVVAVTFVTMGIGVNARTAFSLLYPKILDEFGWERGVTAGAFSVGFVEHKDVRDFHEAGFHVLDVVAETRNQNNENTIGEAHDVDFVLTDAHGFDEDLALACAV